MPRYLFALVLALHGTIHVIGVGRASSVVLAVAWGLAGLGFVIAAILVVARPPWWPRAATPALVLSLLLVWTAWPAAWFGAIANGLIAIPLAIALLDLRPSSLRSRYRADAATALATVDPRALASDDVVTGADLAHLPPPVQRYLRRVGVVGKPRVHDFRATFRGEFRQGKDAPWMPVTVEQVSVVDQPARLFFLQASRGGVPFDAFHRYVGPHATFEVRVAGLLPVADVRGPDMDRSETVTMLNDWCLLAPAALATAPIAWTPIDDRRARATFTNGDHVVTAELEFDDRDELVGFVSADRDQNDGTTSKHVPWSTPVQAYGDTGGLHLWRRGEARWREPAPVGEWAYARLELASIAYNVSA